MQTILIGNEPLSDHHISLLIEWETTIELSPLARARITKASDYIAQKVGSGAVIYGVTTGFGANADKVIAREDTGNLQRNLLLSHACGVGEAFHNDIVKIALLLRIYNFSHGYSGIRLETVERLVFFYNHNIIPVVPSQGSVGASGDLAPLSHIGITLLWEGEVSYEWKIYPTKIIFEKFWLEPLVLSYKEGLALNNGTTFITAIGLYNLYHAKHILDLADAIASMSIEALAGRKEAFDPKPHLVRPHPGQQETARNIRNMLEWSTLFGIDCNKIPWKKVSTQDAYSLRCIPQVHGATKQAYTHIREVLLTELGSVTDNPLIFVDEDEVISAGNFHGEPVALIMDYLKIAIAELGSISERRTAKLVDPNHNEGLPAFLAGSNKDVGLHSGYMIPQYVAASLVSENKVLSHPSSVDSIPTSANIEDHVSMGTTSARQAGMIIENVYKILAIELLLACQAIDIRKQSLDFPRNMGTGTEKIYKEVRNNVSFMAEDRYVAPDISLIISLLHESGFLKDISS
jgi:histidine ammonia-lyase